jgi:hypothetical protein
MITRVWRGWTAEADADDYQRFLLAELFPAMRTISGFLGAEVFRSSQRRSRLGGDQGVKLRGAGPHA